MTSSVAEGGGHGDLRCCGVDVFLFFFDAVNKISICGVAVISTLTVCDGDGVSNGNLSFHNRNFERTSLIPDYS